MCAVQWANRLFPWDYGPARYICALACGDTKLEVRGGAARVVAMQTTTSFKQEHDLLGRVIEVGSQRRAKQSSSLSQLHTRPPLLAPTLPTPRPLRSSSLCPPQPTPSSLNALPSLHPLLSCPHPPLPTPSPLDALPPLHPHLTHLCAPPSFAPGARRGPAGPAPAALPEQPRHRRGQHSRRHRHRQHTDA